MVTATGVDTVLVQAGIMPVHSGSPPPVAVTVFKLGVAAVAPTLTGTVMTMSPRPAGLAIVQPAKVVPEAGQPVTAVPLAGTPLLVLVAKAGALASVMPDGKRSDKLMGADVGLPATLMVMV